MDGVQLTSKTDTGKLITQLAPTWWSSILTVTLPLLASGLQILLDSGVQLRIRQLVTLKANTGSEHYSLSAKSSPLQLNIEVLTG